MFKTFITKTKKRNWKKRFKIEKSYIYIYITLNENNSMKIYN